MLRGSKSYIALTSHNPTYRHNPTAAQINFVVRESLQRHSETQSHNHVSWIVDRHRESTIRARMRPAWMGELETPREAHP